MVIDLVLLTLIRKHEPGARPKQSIAQLLFAAALIFRDTPMHSGVVMPGIFCKGENCYPAHKPVVKDVVCDLFFIPCIKWRVE